LSGLRGRRARGDPITPAAKQLRRRTTRAGRDAEIPPPLSGARHARRDASDPPSGS